MTQWVFCFITPLPNSTIHLSTWQLYPNYLSQTQVKWQRYRDSAGKWQQHGRATTMLRTCNNTDKHDQQGSADKCQGFFLSIHRGGYSFSKTEKAVIGCNVASSFFIVIHSVTIIPTHREPTIAFPYSLCNSIIVLYIYINQQHR